MSSEMDGSTFSVTADEFRCDILNNLHKMLLLEGHAVDFHVSTLILI